MQAFVSRSAVRTPAAASRSRQPSRPHTVQTVAMDMAADIKQTVAGNKVVVYSKSYCPYCAKAKGLFQSLNVPAKVIELDLIDQGDAWQDTLQGITQQRTVPQVFVGGKFVGGNDATQAAYSSGKLKEMLAEAGISI